MIFSINGSLFQTENVSWDISVRSIYLWCQGCEQKSLQLFLINFKRSRIKKTQLLFLCTVEEKEHTYFLVPFGI